MKLWCPPEFFTKNTSHEQLLFMWWTHDDSSMSKKLNYIWKTHQISMSARIFSQKYVSRTITFHVIHISWFWHGYKVEIVLKNSWNCDVRQNFFTKRISRIITFHVIHISWLWHGTTWSLLCAITLLWPVLVQTQTLCSIVSDASNLGCGTSIMQCIDNAWRPITFFSKSFSPAQCKYSTFSRELLWLHLAVKHFRHCFEGNPDMIMCCDHEPLVKAFYSRSQRDNARECRHLSEIASLCTNLKFIRGCDNAVADALNSIEINSIFQHATKIDWHAFAKTQRNDHELKRYLDETNSANQRRNKVRWRPGQEASLATHVQNVLRKQVYCIEENTGWPKKMCTHENFNCDFD